MGSLDRNRSGSKPDDEKKSKSSEARWAELQRQAGSSVEYEVRRHSIQFPPQP
jgi:hypothetical protein